jgi:hypothetical protein
LHIEREGGRGDEWLGGILWGFCLVKIGIGEKKKFERTTRDVERLGKMTYGLNVSNSSAENMVSQGRFECFAYTTKS